jgi:hypothetical protein
MGNKVEAGPERIRYHVPRPHPNKMITDQIRSTVYLIDPCYSPDAVMARSHRRTPSQDRQLPNLALSRRRFAPRLVARVLAAGARHIDGPTG